MKWKASVSTGLAATLVFAVIGLAGCRTKVVLDYGSDPYGRYETGDEGSEDEESSCKHDCK